LAIIEIALASAHATEIEAKRGKATLNKQFVQHDGDAVLHRPTSFGVVVKDQRDRRIFRFGLIVTGFKTPSGASKDKFCHDAQFNS
jgi:hypothetical protein